MRYRYTFLRPLGGGLALLLLATVLTGCGPQAASQPAAAPLATTAPAAAVAATATPAALLTPVAAAGTTAPVPAPPTLPTAPPPPVGALPAVIARVNGVPVTGVLYAQRFTYYEALATNQGIDWSSATGKSYVGQLRTLLLQRLIDQELINQYAAKHKLTTTPKAVQNEIKTLIARNGGQVAYTQMLTSTKLSDLTFSQMISEEMSAANVQKAVTKGMTTTVLEVDARHILVTSLVTATMILNQLHHGADFATLARKYSIDTGSAVKGGDLGYFARGAMVKPFEDAAFSLKVGQISGIVHSTFGYHIIQVIGRKMVAETATQLSTQSSQVFAAWLQAQAAHSTIIRYIKP